MSNMFETDPNKEVEKKSDTGHQHRYTRKQYQPKNCYFTENGITEIDYKDLELVNKFVNESAKIMPRRVTGIKARYQRKVTKAVKLARFLAFIPYCDAHRRYFK